MKWIKFSERKPETGTLCLCKCTDPSDFDVAQYVRYEYQEKGSWVVYCEYGGCAYIPDDGYDYWMPIDEIDKEASK